MIDYPFPGCCEHTANAHSRRHCLLCDCEKQPQVQAPPPEPQMTWSQWADVVTPTMPHFDVDVTDLSICPRCGCLVDAEIHEQWTGCPPPLTTLEESND